MGVCSPRAWKALCGALAFAFIFQQHTVLVKHSFTGLLIRWDGLVFLPLYSLEQSQAAKQEDRLTKALNSFSEAKQMRELRSKCLGDVQEFSVAWSWADDEPFVDLAKNPDVVAEMIFVDFEVHGAVLRGPKSYRALPSPVFSSC